MSSDLIHQSSVRNFIERLCQIQKYNIHINTFIDTICDFIQELFKLPSKYILPSPADSTALCTGLVEISVFI